MTNSQITGVILAGGRSSRMRQDKGLVVVDDLPLYVHIANKLNLQVSSIIINSNQNQEKYAARYPVIGDLIADFSGPLAGMLAGLMASKTEWVLFVPCDVPDFPNDLVKRLWLGRGQSQVAYASDGNRAHPTLCLLNRSLIPSLTSYLAEGERKVMLFFSMCAAEEVIFNQPEAFSNLNTPEDVEHWRASRRDI